MLADFMSTLLHNFLQQKKLVTIRKILHSKLTCPLPYSKRSTP